MSTPSLREIAWTVARDVNGTFGGGNPAMELIRRSFGRRGWMGAEDHGLLVAVSRLTPGTNILAYCVALGWRWYGWRGGVTAVVAGSAPTAALVAGIIATLDRIDRYRSVQVVLAAGTIVAVWLVFASAWFLLRPYLAGGRRWMAAVVGLVCAGLVAMDVTPVRVLLVAAAVGALWRSPATAPPAVR